MYKYKIVWYRTEDDKKWNEEGSNNLDYLLRSLKKPYKNYYGKLFQKNGNRWKQIEA